MFRNIALAFMTLCIAIFGGAASLNYVLNTFDGFGRMHIGQWEAYPKAGTQAADAYAKARSAKRGEISLGRTEGLSFQLWQDKNGDALKGRCYYVLKGQLPETQFFTLYTANKSLRPHKSDTNDNGLPFELHSGNIIRNQDNSIEIIISPTPQEGNWLATNNHGKYGLVLTLYDTPIATSTALQTLVMPSVEPLNKKGRNCE